jgi:tRNA threonylcarbamoyladenosine biosynthesis protein TsaB
MPRVLSIDTTSEFGSLALVEGEELIEELMLHSKDGFSHVMYPHLEGMLAKHGWELDTVDCFAAACGPGSFTGVRVGLAAVKGLAEVMDKPVVTVSNLRALAWFGSLGLRATLLDARRGQIYAGLYDDALEPVAEEMVRKLPEWLEMLPEGEVEFVSTDFAPFRPALMGTRFDGARVTDAPRAQAGVVGRIAMLDFAAGKAMDPAGVDANYVRRADAELKWRDR